MSTADEVREAEQANAARLFVAFLGGLVADLENLEHDPTKAAGGLEAQDLVDAIALLQDVKVRLTAVERDLITTAGHRQGKVIGSLSDGRQFTLERASDRKEWDHDDWKRDVRRSLVERHAHPDAVIVNQETGEETALRVFLHGILAEAQEVHGSTAPRSRALKSLGLYAGDYATSSPNGWRFSAIKLDHSPSTTTDTDTKEPKTDG